MYYAKQKDGKSWLFYEKTNAGKRSIAIASMRLEHGEPVFDLRRLDVTDADEAALQKRFQSLRESILRKLSGIAIYCEGQTEAKYLSEVANALEISKCVSIYSLGGGDPGVHIESIAKKMLWDKALGKDPFREYWMVFDRDGHRNFHASYEIKAHFPNIHLAFTNPCFEYWVAMHHPEFDGRIPLNEERVLKEKKTVEACGTYRKREVIERLYELCASPDDALSLAKKFFPGYEKNGDGYLRLFGSLTEKACERMRALPPPQEGLGSDLPLLLDRLFLMSGLTSKDALARLAKSTAQPELPKEQLNVPQALPSQYSKKEFTADCQQLLTMVNAFRKGRTVDEAKNLQKKLQSILEYIQESIKDVKPIDIHMPHPDSTERARLLLRESVNNISATYFQFNVCIGEIINFSKTFAKNPNRKFKIKTRLRISEYLKSCIIWLDRFICDASEESMADLPILQ